MARSDESHSSLSDSELSFAEAAEQYGARFRLHHYLLVAIIVIPVFLAIPSISGYFAKNGPFPFLNPPQSQDQVDPDHTPSAPVEQQSQAQAQSADVVMSNGYQVGPDGYLIQPKQDIALPEMPKAARQNTPEGANAFSEHYIHAYSYAFLTGDTTELRKLSLPECDSCEERISTIEAFYGKGGWIDGAPH